MFKVGIIGAGWIAEKMAQALAPLPDIETHAISSRSIEKAREFAQKHNIPKAYGSYEEMVADNDIDLVYIATPHSHHFEHAMLALEYGKPVLVEKITRPDDMGNGYEYQVKECKRCIEAGLMESPMMPHRETIDIMKQMDSLRKEWGVVYPMDK